MKYRENAEEENDYRTLSIRQWPESERPRERLLEKGAGSLSTSELLAILIGNGQRGSSAVDLAKNVLAHSRNLHDLTSITLRSIPGMGPAKAAKILAALELGKRALQKNDKANGRLRSSEDVFEWIHPRMLGLTSEVFLVICVDAKNRPLETIEIARGSNDGVLFTPKEVFREAIRADASGVICVHNHPSGDPTPSQLDIDLTTRLKKLAQLVGIRFLDHVIVAENQYYSFVDNC